MNTIGDSWFIRLVSSLQRSILNENQLENLFYQLVLSLRSLLVLSHVLIIGTQKYCFSQY